MRRLIPLLLSAACIHRAPLPPPDPLAAFSAGVQVLSTDSHHREAEAYAHFLTALQSDSTLVHAHYNAGWLAERRGDLDAAVEHYKNAWALRQDDPLLQLAYAEALVAAHRPSEAAILLRDADTPALQQARLEAMLAAGMPHDVVSTGQSLLLTQPGSAATYRAMAQAHAALGQPHLEALCLEKAQALAPLDADLLNNMGVRALDQGDPQRAISSFRSAQAIDPIHRESNLNLGFLALDSGDAVLARDSFEAALQSDPSSPEARIGLAVALRLLHDYEEAGAVYDTLLSELPKDPMVAHNAVMFQLAVRDFKAARKVALRYAKETKDPLADELLREVKAQEEADISHVIDPIQHVYITLIPELKERRAGYAARLAGLEDCPTAIDAGMVEMGQRVLEQVDAVIEMEDATMADDVILFIDEMEQMFLELEAACTEPSPAAPAPQ